MVALITVKTPESPAVIGQVRPLLQRIQPTQRDMLTLSSATNLFIASEVDQD